MKFKIYLSLNYRNLIYLMYPYIKEVIILKFSLDKNSDIPLYVQVYQKIKTMIEENTLKDEKLPSIRSLSKSLGVNNVTIVNAYKLLEQEGYVYSVRGSGTYIKRGFDIEELSFLEDGDMELMVSGILPISSESINFASVSPTPDLFPIEEFKQSLVKVLDRDAGLAFTYPEVNGYEPLRESISKFLSINYEFQVQKEQILITSGGQQGLDIISKTLIHHGDNIFVENPTYPGAMAAFNSRGAKLIGIPILKDGINIRILKLNLKKYKPKFVYVMTNYQSPTTYSYSDEKKRELLSLAKEYNFYIIEDDFLTDLSFRDKKLPLKSMDLNDRVIYIKSFSKIFMPGVRMGFVTLPNNWFKSVLKTKHTTDISSSGFLQRAFDEYLRNGYWKNHIDKVKTVYENKYNLIIQELEKLKIYGIEYIPPNGGLSLWIKLPDGIDCIELYRECSEHDLAIVPGKVFFVDDSMNSNYIRLSFGAVNSNEIVRGIEILKDLLSKTIRDEKDKLLPFI